MMPQFISFYTGDVYYKKKAEQLRDKCESLNIDIEISEVKNRGSYWKNTLYKPLFIYQKLMEKKRDLIWIDADTDIRVRHDSIFNWKADLYFASHTGELDGIKASPIGFKFNDNSIKFLEEWKKACEAKILSNEIDFDHDVLKYEIIPNFKGIISLEIMKGDLEPKEFTDGSIINNGNSRVSGKFSETPFVLRKNTSRSDSFNSLKKEDFLYGK